MSGKWKLAWFSVARLQLCSSRKPTKGEEPLTSRADKEERLVPAACKHQRAPSTQLSWLVNHHFLLGWPYGFFCLFVFWVMPATTSNPSLILLLVNARKAHWLDFGVTVNSVCCRFLSGLGRHVDVLWLPRKCLSYNITSFPASCQQISVSGHWVMLWGTPPALKKVAELFAEPWVPQ